MPKIDIPSIAVRTGTGYPAPFRHIVQGRSWKALGDAAGLTQFGVNLVTLSPGAASSARHWHENEDEFVFVIEGELVLVDDGGDTVMRPGDAAGFKCGVPNGHHLVNRSNRDAAFIVVGTRVPRERCHYADVDLMYEAEGHDGRFTRKNGEPYPVAPSR
jgi:uncharacterized cupin superfamily protein